MAISDTWWHLVIRVTAHGTGMGRRLDYALNDVVRHTQEGADPLADWRTRRPGDVGLWVTWNPLRGMRYVGVTPNLDVLGPTPMQEVVMPPALTRAVLAGIGLALRIDSGEFGAGVDSASAGLADPRNDMRPSDPPPSELIDPATLEIKDGQ